MKKTLLVLLVSLVGMAAQAQWRGHDRDHRGNRWRGNNWNSSQTVYCKSSNYRTNVCYSDVDRVRDIRLLRQYSDSPCLYGRSFGVTNRGAVWVSNGCEGTFRVTGRDW